MADSDVKKATDDLKAIAPDFAQLTQDVIFGNLWKLKKSLNSNKLIYGKLSHWIEDIHNFEMEHAPFRKMATPTLQEAVLKLRRTVTDNNNFMKRSLFQLLGW